MGRAGISSQAARQGRQKCRKQQTGKAGMAALVTAGQDRQIMQAGQGVRVEQAGQAGRPEQCTHARHAVEGSAGRAEQAVFAG